MADRPSRLRVQYVKEGRLAFLGHLEVLHTIDRSVRRSHLPFAVGNGFARRMRIQFSQALPVGSSSRAEFFDLRLTEPLAASEALEALAASTPHDLRPVRAAYVSPSCPALESWLDRQSWRAVPDRPVDPKGLQGALAQLLEEDELHFMRGEKPRVVSVADTLASFAVSEGEGGTSIALETRSSERGALRPQILLDAAFRRMRIAPPYVRVERLGQWHDGGAALVEPFDASTQIPLT